MHQNSWAVVAGDFGVLLDAKRSLTGSRSSVEAASLITKDELRDDEQQWLGLL
jgi:hypothetical protein